MQFAKKSSSDIETCATGCNQFSSNYIIKRPCSKERRQMTAFLIDISI